MSELDPAFEEEMRELAESVRDEIAVLPAELPSLLLDGPFAGKTCRPVTRDGVPLSMHFVYFTEDGWHQLAVYERQQVEHRKVAGVTEPMWTYRWDGRLRQLARADRDEHL